MRERNR